MKKVKVIKIRSPKRGEVSDYTGVVLENVQEQFKIFAEKLESIDEKFEGKFNNIEDSLQGVMYELLDIKSELRAVRDTLNKKADIEKVDKLEKRVFQMEREFEILKRR
ncbi:MAG: hypothetical protein AAB371_02310 [Patescibacteria group bacterium]